MARSPTAPVREECAGVALMPSPARRGTREALSNAPTDVAPPDQEVTLRFGERFIPYPMRDGEEFFAVDWSPDPAAASAPMSDYIYLEAPDLQTTLGFHSGGLTFTLDDLDRAVLATAQIVDKRAQRLKS